MAMKPVEKTLRYQALQRVKQMQRDGAKPSTLERISRSLTTQGRAGHVGLQYSTRRKK